MVIVVVIYRTIKVIRRTLCRLFTALYQNIISNGNPQDTPGLTEQICLQPKNGARAMGYRVQSNGQQDNCPRYRWMDGWIDIHFKSRTSRLSRDFSPSLHVNLYSFLWPPNNTHFLVIKKCIVWCLNLECTTARWYGLCAIYKELVCCLEYKNSSFLGAGDLNSCHCKRTCLLIFLEGWQKPVFP